MMSRHTHTLNARLHCRRARATLFIFWFGLMSNMTKVAALNAHNEWTISTTRWGMTIYVFSCAMCRYSIHWAKPFPQSTYYIHVFIRTFPSFELFAHFNDVDYRELCIRARVCDMVCAIQVCRAVFGAHHNHHLARGWWCVVWWWRVGSRAPRGDLWLSHRPPPLRKGSTTRLRHYPRLSCADLDPSAIQSRPSQSTARALASRIRSSTILIQVNSIFASAPKNKNKIIQELGHSLKEPIGGSHLLLFRYHI